MDPRRDLMLEFMSSVTLFSVSFACFGVLSIVLSLCGLVVVSEKWVAVHSPSAPAGRN